MKTIYTDVSADLSGSSTTQIVRAEKGDTGRTLRVRIRDGGEPYEIAPDCYAVLMGKKPDGTVLYNSCQIADNTIFYPFTEQTCTSVGSFQVQIRLYGPGEKHITTVPIQLEVYPTAFDAEEAAKSQDEQRALDDLVNRTRELQLDILHEKQIGAFDGESAYEIAKRLGFTGSEVEWVESLRYDHSEEFQRLADQVREFVRSAAESAEKAAKAALDAQKIIDDTVTEDKRTWSSRKIAESIEKARKEAIDSCAPPFEKTGPIVQGHLVPNYPMEVISHIVPVQDGEGDPSTENVRPIHGVSELNLIKCGSNLIDKKNYLNAYLSPTKIEAIGDGTTVWFPCVPNTDFVVHKKMGQRFAAAWTAEKPQIGVEIHGFTLNHTAETIAIRTGERAKYIVAFIHKGSADTISKEEMLDSVQANPGKTVEAYAPYVSETYAQMLPEEVFGGSYNWLTGELTDRPSMSVLTNPDSVGTHANGTPYARFFNLNVKANSILMCSRYKPTIYTDQPGFIYSPTNDAIIITDSRFTDLETAKRILAEEKPMVVYMPFNPIPSVQLPSTPKILSKDGVTTAYSNSGNTTVIARANPAHLLSSMQSDIAALQDMILKP